MVDPLVLYHHNIVSIFIRCYIKVRIYSDNTQSIIICIANV